MARGTVLVIGGGTMGRGIAGLCAVSGYITRLYEAAAEVRASLRADIEASWRRAVERKKIAPEAAAAAARRLDMLGSLDVPARCDFVLEAAPESLDAKRGIFAELDRLAPEQTILASNTSSLSIRAIASATRRPDRVIGIHFFNPVAAMPLVELVLSPETSADTYSRAAAFAADLGKQIVRVRDSPGFATSRLGLALGLEAMRMVEEEVASAADIDRAMELGYGHKLGPLKTSDLVGLDVRLAIADALARELDPVRFRPPEILKRLVAAGKTGKKSGEGFYRWETEPPVDAGEAREKR